ncbi:aspartyl-phosphate phosphatase Spo0E family protein [Bacillus dakarensis]|uniref:aspartyl-phosphate phosphatase Spo0E family protein n=1 Tax=Robertmurraya dakarensis TaxID=1926278 RepID=UPI000980BFF5|nr:aspartyl-phosphate phosphatase Spo0E family protein [Bacillus dakarensis]
MMMKMIENRINELKKELAGTANATGINSVETLNCSQKLDQLITIYQLHLKDRTDE